MNDSSSEKEVLLLVSEGSGNPQICERLSMSSKKVEKHRENICKKLEADSMVDLKKYVRSFGLV